MKKIINGMVEDLEFEVKINNLSFYCVKDKRREKDCITNQTSKVDLDNKEENAKILKMNLFGGNDD